MLYVLIFAGVVGASVGVYFIIQTVRSDDGKKQLAAVARSRVPSSRSPCRCQRCHEALCYTYHHLFGIDVTVFRYFTVYGPAGRPEMVPFRLAQWISEGRPGTVYGEGTQSRNFTYVDDIARGTIAGLKPLGFEVLNLGSDHPVVLRDLIRLMEEMLDRKAVLNYLPSHPADVTATWADIEKARRLLDWRPQMDLNTGVAALLTWYQQQRSWAKDIATL